AGMDSPPSLSAVRQETERAAAATTTHRATARSCSRAVGPVLAQHLLERERLLCARVTFTIVEPMRTIADDVAAKAHARCAVLSRPLLTGAKKLRAGA